MLNSYLKFILKRPLIPILVLFGITLVLGAGIFKIEFDNSVESFMPKKDAAYLKYCKARDIYGDNDRFVLMSVSHSHLWSAPAFARIDQFITDIEAYKDYNAQKESRHMAKFREAVNRPHVRFQDIIQEFEDDDPAFVRFLKRKTPPRIQTDNLLNTSDISRIEKIIIKDESLKKTDTIDTIISPFTVQDISGANDTLETYDLIQKDSGDRRKMPGSPAEIQTFKNRLMKNPAFQQGIYAIDSKTGEITDFAVLIKFAGGLDPDAVVSEVINIADTYPDLDIIISGVPFVNKKFNDYIRDDLRKNIPLVLMVVIIVFYLNFRSKRGIILPLLTLGMTEIWTIGLMGHLGCKLTPVGTTLPPLLISVGSSYAIHILNQYYADFDLITRSDKHKGIELAMSHISITVFLAGFTTFAAFLTVLTSQVTAIQSWGIFSAIGIFFAVFIAVTLIPCALVFLPHRYPLALLGKDSEKRITLMDRLLEVIAKTAVRHHKAVYGIVAIVLAVAIPGALQLKVDTEFLHYFKESDPVRHSVTVAGDKFGGGWGFSIILDSGAKDGVTSPEFLNAIENIRTWLVAEGNDDLNVGRTDAFPDFIKRMHMAMNNDSTDFYRVPENRMDIMDYLEILSGEDKDSDGRLDMFEPFIDHDFRHANVLVRLTHKANDRLGTTEINHLIQKIKTHLTETLPEPWTFSITGYPIINIQMAHYVVMGQMQGLFFSLLIVAATIMLLFKKFSAGPLAMIDMVVTILINFGVMGWLGIELDMVTSVIAAITIGIGVDDTIHFLNTYRFIKHEGISVSEAIEQTIQVAGKAIIFTSLALVCGFLMLVTSNFRPIILFGVLLSMTLTISTICSILLIPAAIRITGIDLTRRRSVVREACGKNTDNPDVLRNNQD